MALLLTGILFLALTVLYPATGYWLSAGLRGGAGPGFRFAVACLAGLLSQLLVISLVNAWLPLTGWAAASCVALPLAATLLGGASRRAFFADLDALFCTTRGWGAALGVSFVVGVLLWPVLMSPELVFWDGTSNHDNFFWIVGAEYLQQHDYFARVQAIAERPLLNNVNAFLGWKPDWGRMASEGLLATWSSVLHVPVLHLYVAGSLSLLIPWSAAVWLFVRTLFFGPSDDSKPVRTLPTWVIMFGTAVQPIFAFFFTNGNLPNLLGALSGAGAVLSASLFLQGGLAHTERAEPRRWAGLFILSLHGLLCSYPEMIPFVGLPIALLWVRAWRSGPPRRAVQLVVASLVAALIDPPATYRAIIGFLSSFNIARDNENWGNLFAPLELPEYIPAAFTLSIPAASQLGWWLGVPIAVGLVAAAILSTRASRDRWGLTASLAGSATLLAYTLATGFKYGWQKTVQFAAIPLTAWLPAGALIWAARPEGRLGRVGRTAVAAGVILFFGYALIRTGMRNAEWASRKVLTSDILEFSTHAREELRDRPVVVLAESFPMAFFYSMWVAYLLPHSDLFYSPYGVEAGGYLRHHVKLESPGESPQPAGYVVGRRWSETLDANSPRLLESSEVVVLTQTNRVSTRSGLFPENGPPDIAGERIELTITPHRDSLLEFELRARDEGAASATWTAVAVEGSMAAVIASPQPGVWRIQMPLKSGQANTLSLQATLARPSARAPYPFQVERIEVVTDSSAP